MGRIDPHPGLVAQPPQLSQDPLLVAHEILGIPFGETIHAAGLGRGEGLPSGDGDLRVHVHQDDQIGFRQVGEALEDEVLVEFGLQEKAGRELEVPAVRDDEPALAQQGLDLAPVQDAEPRDDQVEPVRVPPLPQGGVLRIIPQDLAQVPQAIGEIRLESFDALLVHQDGVEAAPAQVVDDRRRQGRLSRGIAALETNEHAGAWFFCIHFKTSAGRLLCRENSARISNRKAGRKEPARRLSGGFDPSPGCGPPEAPAVPPGGSPGPDGTRSRWG